MPVVAAVSPKGGAGKSTSMVSLAMQIAKRGGRVALLDADPNQPLAEFLTSGHCPENLHIILGVTEDNISNEIRKADAQYPFVLVDLEGTAAKIVVNALQLSDYVIIPMRGSHLDAKEAAKAIQLIKDQELAVQRHVPNYQLPFSILITCTPSAYQTRITSGLREDLGKLGVDIFDAEMKERDAYKALFKYYCPLEVMDPAEVPGLEGAITNAEAIAAEFLTKLQPLLEKK